MKTSSLNAVDIGDAKKRLSQLVERAASGTDVVISRGGKPVVRITRLVCTKRQIKFGVLQGKLSMPVQFDAPLPPEVLGSFESE
jgi:antitoxin (DNA-binding transcriptional repressor) of toxin-antitoxin stability system